MATAGAMSDLVLTGIDYRSAPDELRERLFQEPLPVADGLAGLKARGLEAAALIATCERIELLLPGPSPEGESAARAWLGSLAAGDAQRAELLAACYRHRGEDALLHLWRVSASLESAVPGEPQILGQVREAERLAREAGMLPPALAEAFQSAFAAAKRVRSETALGQRAVTMASAAVQVARDLFGDLSRCRLLLLGSGESVELFVEPFRAAGLERVFICHPRDARAEAAARRLGGHARYWTELEKALAEAEIVVTGLASAHYSLERGRLEGVLKARRHKPMLAIDGGVPGDVDPAAGELEDLFLYDLGDLETLALAGQARRQLAGEKAEAILAEEMERWRNRRERRSRAALLRQAEEGLRALAADESADEPKQSRTAERLAERLLGRLETALLGLEPLEIEQRSLLERLITCVFSGKDADKEKNE